MNASAEVISMGRPDASKPNPSLCLWLALDKPVGRLDIALVDLVLAGLNVNRHKLVRLRIDVDVWAHALLEYCISPPGKLFVTQFLYVHNSVTRLSIESGLVRTQEQRRSFSPERSGANPTSRRGLFASGGNETGRASPFSPFSLSSTRFAPALLRFAQGASVAGSL